MRYRSLFSILFFITVLFTACGGDSEPDLSEPQDDGVRETYDAVEEDIKISREGFVSRVRDEIEEIEDDMEEIRLEIENEADGQQSELRAEWQEFLEEKNDLKKDLETLKERSIDDWHKMRKEYDKRVDTLKIQFNQLKNKVEQ